MAFAAGTSVPIERSRAEIENILKRYGASKFVSGWDEEKAVIAFEMTGRRIRFELPIPPLSVFLHMKIRKDSHLTISESEAIKRQEQESRRRFRALALVIKAKLEAVESNVSTFEQEFLAHIVLPNGNTVGEWISPQLATVYNNGKMPPLLPR